MFRSSRITRTRSLARFILGRSLVGMLFVTTPAVGPAQSMSGAMAVSATILPPDDMRAAQLISVSVASTGVARLDTVAPIAGAASQIVMVTVSSPTNRFAPVAQPPLLVMGTQCGSRSGGVTTSSDASPAKRQRYEVNVGRRPIDPTPDSASLRITYVIVPST